ncbi:MAG: alpha/beta hydrolase [Bacteroidetes bacterium]|nr:MAG: alpha/beta hydrolase [Bacteroidota bacterium]PTM14527.1 MAG: alpha/beta hydrolase [Bacteroidota bacterium]
MSLKKWKNSGQYFLYRGQHRVFYQSAGAGPVLVLLHGFPTASWDWHKVWPSLAAHFRVLALDFIGFGFSDKPRKYNYSLMDQAYLVEALLTDQGVKAYHLLAHDYGDTVAQELLARHYERDPYTSQSPRLLSLVLLNGGIFPGIHHPLPIQRALASRWGGLLTPFLNRGMLRRNFRQIFGPQTQPTEQEIDEFYALLSHQQGKYLFHRLIRYMHEREVHESRWVGAIQRAELPQRLINGAYDPISGQHVADHYRKVVPRPDVVVLEDIGHYPQTEGPEAVVAAILAFHVQRP